MFYFDSERRKKLNTRRRWRVWDWDDRWKSSKSLAAFRRFHRMSNLVPHVRCHKTASSNFSFSPNASSNLFIYTHTAYMMHSNATEYVWRECAALTHDQFWRNSGKISSTFHLVFTFVLLRVIEIKAKTFVVCHGRFIDNSLSLSHFLLALFKMNYCTERNH